MWLNILGDSKVINSKNDWDNNPGLHSPLIWCCGSYYGIICTTAITEQLRGMYHQADIKQWKFLKNCSSPCDKCSASIITLHLLQRQVFTTTFSSKSKLKPISIMILLGIVRNWDIAGGLGEIDSST